jgi:sensor histidine kinase YesM
MLVALVWGAQNTLGASLLGEAASLSAALRTAFVQSVPWVPVTLAVIYLTIRFPLSRPVWRRNLAIHVPAALLVTFGANVLVVLGFWWLQGQFQSGGALFRSALLWTTLRLHIGVLIYAAIATLTQVVLYFRDMRDRELHVARLESQLARARLQALSAQIRPHFLFNTLHTIGQLWRSGHSEHADVVLDQLGRLLQKVQSTASSAEVPLAEEVELVRDYLAIEQTRFRDRMRTVVDVPPETLRCLVPPLILQPLVENAVRHGIAAVSSASLVEVKAAIEGRRLLLSVRDDGPGIAAVPPQPGSGTGLDNTRQRLQELYGNSAGLRVDSAPGAGTTIRIELPARDSDDLDGESLRD